MSQYNAPMQGALPRPGKALKIVLLSLLGIWVLFAMAINFGGASEELFYLLCGRTDAILGGQVWRLFTAPLMHITTGDVGHILFTLIGLYFLTPSLESKWGTARTLRFLFFSGVLAYALQIGVDLLLPASLSAKLVPGYWFGAGPIVEAVAVAFALSFRGRTVNLMFVLPVTSTGLLLFIFGFSVLRVIATQHVPEGLISPFGGMVAGWALGGGTPSPLRQLYLRFRLAQLENEVRPKKKRKNPGNLRVIKGGQDDTPSKGPDGRWLN
jgi:membrane associated rhomboid family serine protease